MKIKRYWTVALIVVAITVITLLNAIISPPATGQAMGEEGYSFSSLDSLGTVKAVEVKGDYAYLLDYYNLMIVDVSNPLAPVELSKTELVATDDYVNDVEVSGHYAYVAAGDSGTQIVDVSDPLHPQVVGSTYGYGAEGVTIEESILVEGYNRYIDGYIVSGGVRIYDVTDPIRPVEIGSIFHAGFVPYGDAKSVIAIAGDYVYGAIAMDSIVEIIPIDDPSAHTAFYDWPDGIRFEPRNVVAFDHYLYVSGYVSGSVNEAGSKIAIFDISDPLAPVWVNLFGTLARNMVIDDEKLYVGGGAIIGIYDLADPANPSLLFSHDTKQWIQDIDAQDDCVYVGTYRNGFDVLCASEPVVTLTPSPTASVGEKLYLPLIQNTAL